MSSPRSRTVLVTYLGAIVRRMGDWMPIAGTVELMTQVGLDAPSVRTAVFRLKQRGWLDTSSRDGLRGYGLTAHAQQALAAGDEIVWHARQPADLTAGWCIVNVSVPESARAKRHRLRAHLTSLGFGNVGTAMWIAPARMQRAAEQAISELGLTDRCAMFTGDHVAGKDLTTLLHESWDLDEIDRGYREFARQYRPVLNRVTSFDAGRAFVTYVEVIDSWRKLPYRDPGLPPELLSHDWSAPRAGRLFEQLVGRLERPALAFASGYWPAVSRAG